MIRRLYSLLLLLSPLVAPAALAQSGPQLWIADASIVEGDTGTTTLTFYVQLSYAAPGPVTAEIVFGSGSARAGEDFLDPGPTAMSIPKGGHGTTVSVQVVGDLIPEGDETFYVIPRDIQGAHLSMTMPLFTGTILDDEPPPPVQAVDDLARVKVNSGGESLWPVSNDIVPPGVTPSVTLLDEPMHGEVSVNTVLLTYVPDPDFLGTDSFRYRVCYAGDCDDALVTVVVQLATGPSTMWIGETSGWLGHSVTDWPALPSARFDASSLAAPEALAWLVGVDPTPGSPFDGPEGTAWDLRTVPADGPERVLVLVDPPSGGAVRVGIDHDGDGKPSAGEQCLLNPCEVPRAAGQSAAYWVLAHNAASSSATIAFRLYEVDAASDGSAWITGPGHVAAGTDFSLEGGYADDTLRVGDDRMLLVTVRADDDTVLGHVPMRLVFEEEFTEAPVPLRDGVPHAFALEAEDSHPVTFIDVPAGTTRLSVSSSSDADIDLHLVQGYIETGTTETFVQHSPPISGAVRSATGPGGNETVTIEGSVAAGRWYVVAHNASPAAARYTLTAQIDAVAPAVRPGSYFNAARSGNGVFLYPAGDQLTGLWYTYDRFEQPTWYWLQAEAPASDGIWTSPLYRAAWDGTRHRLVAAGHATVTPMAGDRFQFTYRLDGKTGSEPYAALGRGCPAGGTVDISGTWFDPARAGTGYSVQMFDDYEYVAAFYYDDLGLPRFVAAELDHFGGDDATLIVQQLRSRCPVCGYDVPERTDIGTLRRRLGPDGLTTIETDLEFEPPVGGGWTAADAVQLIGGEGTSQGCDP